MFKKADLPMSVDLEAAAFHMKKEMTERDMIGRIKNRAIVLSMKVKRMIFQILIGKPSYNVVKKLIR